MCSMIIKILLKSHSIRYNNTSGLCCTLNTLRKVYLYNIFHYIAIKSAYCPALTTCYITAIICQFKCMYSNGSPSAVIMQLSDI